MTHARQVRETLRSVLWQAAVARTLPHGLDAQLEHLGSTAAESIDLDREETRRWAWLVVPTGRRGSTRKRRRRGGGGGGVLKRGPG